MFNYDTIGNGKAVSAILLLCGVLGIASIMVMDATFWHRGFLHEDWPDFSSSYLIRSFAICISVLVIIGAVTRNNTPDFILADNKNAAFVLLFVLMTLSSSVVILGLFIFDPATFNQLSLEDGPVEWMSALLLFGCCFIGTAAYIKARRTNVFSKLIQYSLLLLSAVFFVMAMEEISWFQRQLGIITPEAFDANHQKEINLHNFATNYVENLYYFGAFTFLVILPFARWLIPFISTNDYLSTFTARPYIAVIGAIACAYNFDMWNIIFTQIAFFASIIILLVYAVFSADKLSRLITSLTAFIVLATQTFFLSNGSDFARLWEVTEYKELFIPLAFFVYSIDLFNTVNRAGMPGENGLNLGSDNSSEGYTIKKS